MGLFQSQNKSYLTASSNYAMDYATAQLMAANAYGAKQDINTQRLYDLIGLSRSKPQSLETFNQIGLVIAAGAVLTIIVYLIFKK